MTTTDDRIPGSVDTRRQARALGGIVPHRGMQVDTLALFLGTNRSHSYEVAAELLALGLVHPLREIGAGAKWILPTSLGVRWYLGRSGSTWRPSLLWSIRARAVVHTRIALGARDHDAWRTDHDLCIDNAHPGRYLYDGQWNTPDTFVAVKVDTAAYRLTPAKLTDTLRRLTTRVREDSCGGLLWVAHGATPADIVRTALAELPDHGQALTVAVVDYTDLTDPNTPVITPWGVA
ncbi:hypothetical protein [Nocardia sp. NPDC005366]|uniref:hypothetical protein n=1 Tax=Nocardia sp. NPDC005366 TaxID=3156878 RepID=UPI0033A6A37F